MKKYINTKNVILITILFLVCISCGKFEVSVVPMNTIDLEGVSESYSNLEEYSTLTIPIKYTTSCDSGIDSAYYKIANKRVSDISLLYSPAMQLPIHDKTIDTTINIPVRKGLAGIIIVIFDKSGQVSYKNITVKNVIAATGNLKTLTDVEMSTDTADHKCFFSLYEDTPVFGRSEALTKQDRIDFFLPNMSGAKFVSCHAFSASSSYYSYSLPFLKGFSTLTYCFLSSSKTYISKDAFDAITTEEDLAEFIDSTVISTNSYNVLSADRRVGESLATVSTSLNKGFLIGWGYHTHPTAGTSVVLNESFGLIMVKSVSKKSNGNYVITFDIKGPAADQQEAYPMSSVAPYGTYTLE